MKVGLIWPLLLYIAVPLFNEGLDQLKRRMDWIAGIAGGEEEAAGFKINKFHCVSCDRPVHALARQQPAPTVPALPGLNVS